MIIILWSGMFHVPAFINGRASLSAVPNFSFLKGFLILNTLQTPREISLLKLLQN